MIRVLQCVNDMHRAGLETMLMNYYRNIDRTKIQFDFLTHRPDKSDYDDEILSLGGKVYYAPRLYPQNYPAYFKYMKKFFAEHPEYQIVHSHIDSMSYLPLLAAKKAGVPIRIAHSHNTSIDKDFKYILKQYFRKKITKAANYYCACGQEAGEFLFPGKEFTFIPNAIEVDKFLYNEEVRDRKRKDLGLTSEFVVGHVGRLSYQKNHELLIACMQVCYTELSENTERIEQAEAEITALREQLKNTILHKQDMEMRNTEVYKYMHNLLGPDVVEIFDRDHRVWRGNMEENHLDAGGNNE